METQLLPPDEPERVTNPLQVGDFIDCKFGKCKVIESTPDFGKDHLYVIETDSGKRHMVAHRRIEKDSVFHRVTAPPKKLRLFRTYRGRLVGHMV